MVPSQDLAAACVGGTSANQSDIIAALVRTITVGHDKVTIEINRRTLADRLLDHEELSASVVESRRPIIIAHFDSTPGKAPGFFSLWEKLTRRSPDVRAISGRGGQGMTNI
jgi:hypothetical protein